MVHVPFSVCHILVERTMASLRQGRSRIQFPADSNDFFFLKSFNPAVGPTEPCVQWVPGAKWPGREADDSIPSSAEVRMNGSCTPPIRCQCARSDNSRCGVWTLSWREWYEPREKSHSLRDFQRMRGLSLEKNLFQCHLSVSMRPLSVTCHYFLLLFRLSSFPMPVTRLFYYLRSCPPSFLPLLYVKTVENKSLYRVFHDFRA